jgi:hypothetical protein
VASLKSDGETEELEEVNLARDNQNNSAITIIIDYIDPSI